MKTRSSYLAPLALGLLLMTTGCSPQATKRTDRAKAEQAETVNKTEGYFYHDNTPIQPGDTTQNHNRLYNK